MFMPAGGEPPIPLPDYIVQVVKRNPWTAQVSSELNLRAHELSCLEMPNGRHVLMEVDVYNMLIEVLVDAMLDDPGQREAK